ncbi:RagB/SusD family nutrient uptake outer membrane protein [Carboxylicivirga taeanensis]|uniref:RagB/SusD family nutrient uptake outer membrane protein n=1 Tax=Carboxylicivirga taeanensis TaxID=1416875 RepID=UPI003F6E25BA
MLTRYKILYILMCFIVVTSCDDYLNVAPDNRQELKTLDNLRELLVSSYSEASYIFIEWKTDNAVAIADNTQYDWMNENFQFKPVVSSENQDTPTYLWSSNYTAIAHSNQVLKTIDEVENTNQALYNAIKGEALITRAYNHFILANIFCQSYDKTTASSELGIPYIIAPEVELLVHYERGTLEQTYNLIKKDLEAALPLINDKFYVGTGKYHFTKQAAYAFASRFYLYVKDYENCIKYSNLILGSGVPAPGTYRDMNAVFEGNNFKEIGAQFVDVEDPANLLVVRKMTLNVTRGTRGYRSDNNIFNDIFNANIQESADYRRQPWGASTDARYQPKYGELFEYTTATTGYPYYIQPEFRTEEVIFNRMEAYIATGRTADALGDYNTIAPSRYKNGGQLTMEQVLSFYDKEDETEAMWLFILDERRKEFLGEGLRWWDIKRFKLPITHIDVRGDEFALADDDLKKAIQIPAKAIAQGIQENPR